MRRGEVWWAELDQPAGRRPVLLISRNEAYIVRSLVIVAPVTTRIRNIPTEVPLSAAEGMSRDCVVNLDNHYDYAKGLPYQSDYHLEFSANQRGRGRYSFCHGNGVIIQSNSWTHRSEIEPSNT